MNIIIFDVETNGMEGSSVLSLSALKCKINDYNDKNQSKSFQLSVIS